LSEIYLHGAPGDAADSSRSCSMVGWVKLIRPPEEVASQWRVGQAVGLLMVESQNFSSVGSSSPYEATVTFSHCTECLRCQIRLPRQDGCLSIGCSTSLPAFVTVMCQQHPSFGISLSSKGVIHVPIFCLGILRVFHLQNLPFPGLLKLWVYGTRVVQLRGPHSRQTVQA
jgi:hypothetical protein